jgi:hypothetical protein
MGSPISAVMLQMTYLIFFLSLPMLEWFSGHWNRVFEKKSVFNWNWGEIIEYL